MTTNVHYATPNVAVFDNRGLTLCKIGYCRSEVGQPAEERISRSTYDIAGNVQSSVDPRLFHIADAANFRFQPTLAGYMARIDSADAGSRWQLNDIEGRPIWQRDARGTEQRYHYDAAGRVVERLENTRSQERWTYGENTADPQRRNLRGQVAERTDQAGTLSYTECGYSLLGRPWQQTRHLDEQHYTTRWRYDAQSRPLEQTDAKGHRQYSVYDVAGRLQSSTLVVNGGTDQPRTVVADTLYNAAGKKLRVTFGNGVITRYDYEPQTQRLTGITSTRPGKPPLQRLRYQYDPAGNLLQITDEAQPVRYFRNQKTDGTKTFRYDSLYQLIEATGRENATAIDSGNDDIQITSLDAEYVNYTRAYDYDAGGNLLKTCHCGAASYTRQLTVAATSNRAISGANLAGDDIDEHFDACGNPKQLDSGQTLQWNGLSQLASITTIARADSDDGEVYLYDGDGQRLRKTNRSLASIRSSNRINIQDTLYLPGLELRNSGAEQLQVINAGSARVLYWTAGKPDDIDNPQLRYQLDAPTGSSQIELDDQADIITQEDYYPYGGTAVRSGRTTSEVDYKTQRYGGHERDASGLYCDGAGYYQPWLGRRLSSDSNNGGYNGYWMVWKPKKPDGYGPVGQNDSDARSGPGTRDLYEEQALFRIGGDDGAGSLNEDEASFTERTPLLDSGYDTAEFRNILSASIMMRPSAFSIGDSDVAGSEEFGLQLQVVRETDSAGFRIDDEAETLLDNNDDSSDVVHFDNTSDIVLFERDSSVSYVLDEDITTSGEALNKAGAKKFLDDLVNRFNVVVEMFIDGLSRLFGGLSAQVREIFGGTDQNSGYSRIDTEQFELDDGDHNDDLISNDHHTNNRPADFIARARAIARV